MPETPAPVCRVTRRVHFNAAHRLHNPARSDEWNRATFGPCNSPNYHGHNYEMDVTIEGPVDPETGYVFDLGILQRIVDETILERLDHKNLNLDVDWFRELIPSAEHIAIVCWRQLAPKLPAGLALSVRLWETPRNSVEYAGG
ncbi:MAG: 6-carboxytetrahydropterin synthase [Gemmatimonadales bacterium]|nr:6-carboxytetrahydropterin synthase [Gemmatimonadales bacterium]